MSAATGPSPFDLKRAFIAHTGMMRAKFDMVAAATNHGPTIGDGSEEAWKEMLREFLPKRYTVNKGFVVDSNGDSGEQIDLIIHDRHFSPMFCAPGDALFVPAESVYAVFEAKQVLSKEYIEAAAAKAASVRRLHRTSAPIPQLSQQSAPKTPPRILAGIVTGRNSWRSGFGGPLVAALEPLDDDHRLDLGCTLDTGMFELPEGAAVSDLEQSGANVGLAMFSMRLIARLNSMGTVPALDAAAYTAKLTEPVDTAPSA